jgi:hypothetical protein
MPRKTKAEYGSELANWAEAEVLLLYLAVLGDNANRSDEEEEFDVEFTPGRSANCTGSSSPLSGDGSRGPTMIV